LSSHKEAKAEVLTLGFASLSTFYFKNDFDTKVIFKIKLEILMLLTNDSSAEQVFKELKSYLDNCQCFGLQESILSAMCKIAANSYNGQVQVYDILSKLADDCLLESQDLGKIKVFIRTLTILFSLIDEENIQHHTEILDYRGTLLKKCGEVLILHLGSKIASNTPDEFFVDDQTAKILWWYFTNKPSNVILFNICTEILRLSLLILQLGNQNKLFRTVAMLNCLKIVTFTPKEQVPRFLFEKTIAANVLVDNRLVIQCATLFEQIYRERVEGRSTELDSIFYEAEFSKHLKSGFKQNSNLEYDLEVYEIGTVSNLIQKELKGYIRLPAKDIPAKKLPSKISTTELKVSRENESSMSEDFESSDCDISESDE